MSGTLGWVTAVFDDWPGPIAHEYRRLADMIPESIDSAAEPTYQVVGAQIQLKDVAEVVIKLPTIVMLRDAERGGVDVTQVKGLLLNAPPSLGKWLDAATRLAKQLRSRDDCLTTDLVGMFLDDRGKPTAFSRRLQKLVEWRNRELGHGALRMDLGPLAAELVENVAAFNRDLADVAARRPWRHLSIRVEGHDDVLVGAESIRQQHDRADPGSHADRDATLICHRAGSRHKLDLGPYAAARICAATGCGRRDVFFYNGRSGGATGTVQYLDYMMGHSLLQPQAGDQRWADEVWGIRGGRGRGAVGDKWIDDTLVTLLDSTDQSREYVEPTYLLEDMRDFLGNHDRGILWLRAPAHTGKTVFASRLAKLLAEEPGDVKVAAFLIKREYRFGLGMFNSFIEKSFQEARTSQYQRKFSWNEPGDRTMAECFVEEAGVLVERAWTGGGNHDRVLLVLDGMDELPAPGAYGEPSDRNSIADLIPPADALPAGMYLLLTSRPDSADETPAWVLDRLTSATEGQRNARIVDINRDTKPYRLLLRRCFDDQRTKKSWKAGGIDDPDGLFEALGDRADWTFLFFGHLLRLLRDGVITTTDVNRMEGRGEQLFLVYLERLQSLLGEKAYQPIRELILVLAACEEAHARTAAIMPPRFFDAQWRGVPLDELAGLLHEPSTEAPEDDDDRPVGIPHRLLFMLQSVADILRSHRQDESYASYAIGLKGLVNALREDRSPGGWASRLDDTHHRIVRDAIVAAKRFFQDPTSDESTPGEYYLIWKGWGHARALLAFGSPDTVTRVTETLRGYTIPGSLILERAEVFANDWLPSVACETLSLAIDMLRWRLDSRHGEDATEDAKDLARAYQWRAVIRSDGFDRAGADEDYAQARSIIDRELKALGRRAPWGLKYGRIVTLMSRSAHLGEFGAVHEAFKGFESVVKLCESLRREASPDNRREAEVLLATALMNRGFSRANAGDLVKACADYDRSISLLRMHRSSRGGRSDPEQCVMLCSALTKRGLALEESGDCAKASRDFGVAIRLLEKGLERWPWDAAKDALHELAEAYGSRGGLSGAGVTTTKRLDDYGRAIRILKRLVGDGGGEHLFDVNEQLALTYRNRAHAHAGAGHQRRALADYGRAIEVFEGMRTSADYVWSVGVCEDLWELYGLRESLRRETGDVVGADEDWSNAFATLDDAIESLEAQVGSRNQEWARSDRHLLARCLANRSNMRSMSDDNAGSLEDSGRAVSLVASFMKEMSRATAQEVTEWFGVASVAFLTRADVFDEMGDVASAVRECSEGIACMEALCRRLGDRCSTDQREALGEAVRQLADLREKCGDGA